MQRSWRRAALQAFCRRLLPDTILIVSFYDTSGDGATEMKSRFVCRFLACVVYLPVPVPVVRQMDNNPVTG